MTTFHIGAALAPALEKMTNIITNVAVKINDWITKNHAIIARVHQQSKNTPAQ